MAWVVALIAFYWFNLGLYVIRRAREDQLVDVAEIIFGF